jgi:hypothetical protein
MDCTVVLNDSCDLSAILLEELGSPVADCSETLNDERAILDALWQLDFIAEVLIAC